MSGKSKYRPAVRKALWALELFRTFPESDIAARLRIKQCSASFLRHNRKPKVRTKGDLKVRPGPSIVLPAYYPKRRKPSKTAGFRAKD